MTNADRAKELTAQIPGFKIGAATEDEGKSAGLDNPSEPFGECLRLCVVLERLSR